MYLLIFLWNHFISQALNVLLSDARSYIYYAVFVNNLSLEKQRNTSCRYLVVTCYLKKNTSKYVGQVYFCYFTYCMGCKIKIKMTSVLFLRVQTNHFFKTHPKTISFFLKISKNQMISIYGNSFRTVLFAFL